MNMKGQVAVIDVLLFSLLAVLVMFVILNPVLENVSKKKSEAQGLKELEQLLLAERFVSDCNYLAYTPENRKGLCYKNLLKDEISGLQITELRDNNVCLLKIGNRVIYENKISEVRTSVTRGVVDNGMFKVLEISFC